MLRSVTSTSTAARQWPFRQRLTVKPLFSLSFLSTITEKTAVLKVDDVVEITIENINNVGWGVGSITNTNTNRNKKQPVVMVPKVMYGETVLAKITRDHGKFWHAELVHIVQPSPDRIVPKCPHFNDCGGCQFQHIPIELQRKWKTHKIYVGLAKRGLHNVKVASTSGTPHVYGYRNKVSLHRGTNKKSSTVIGFHHHHIEKGIVDIQYCPVATKSINAAYRKRRQELLDAPSDNDASTQWLFRQGNDRTKIATNEDEWVTMTVKGLDFTYRAGSFFQVNHHAINLLVDHVLTAASADHTITHLVDCYCGCGLFALCAAKRIQTIFGIEISPEAVQEANHNAAQNGITNCRFLAGSSEDMFATLGNALPSHQTAVIVNPPRKGCSQPFLEQLFQLGPQRILYLSCDPRTQGRDAVSIVDNGYDIKTVQPFDLFPQTRHVECLMVFEKRKQ